MLSGLILDNVLVFLYRLARRAFDDLRSREWRLVDGAVEATWVSGTARYPETTTRYRYRVEAFEFKGLYRQPFWTKNKAERFAAMVGPETPVKLRVDPAYASSSTLNTSDQR